MKVLNLYSGLGGNRKNWLDVEVTAVEKSPEIAEIYKRHNPDDVVIVDDAHEYLLNHYHEFQFIWSSPPCQSHSKMIRSGRNRQTRFVDLSLYEEILLLMHDFEGFYCVENVVPFYEPLIKPQKIGRHLFWSNFTIEPMVNDLFMQNGENPEFKNFINEQNLNSKRELQDWLGIHFEENIYYENNHCPTQILRNCVHPNVGEHIFNCMLQSRSQDHKEENQLEMF
jgi:DNA (cytosine-5)-methyltransferase 1